MSIIDIEDLKSVNRLWSEVYPYLAAQVMQAYGRGSGEVLELGSFAGGISVGLARSYPQLRLTIADESDEYLTYLGEELCTQGLERRIKLVKTTLDKLAFADRHFDLVILRGAFFFIMDRPGIVSEILRVLAKGGLAFVGGGYGKGIPPPLIDRIADESRILNDRLGRRRVSMDELKNVIAQAGLVGQCRIVEEGGVWLEIRK